MSWPGVLRDVQHGIRVLSKTPGFTVVANSYGRVSHRPECRDVQGGERIAAQRAAVQKPRKHCGDLERVAAKRFPKLPLFNAEFENLQRKNHVFTELAGFKPLRANLTDAGEPERLDGAHLPLCSPSWAFLPTRTNLHFERRRTCYEPGGSSRL
jgi:hypothetical protein